MNKKEEALKLVQEYGMLGLKWKQTEYTTLDLENAKECAIVHVDGIIKEHCHESEHKNPIAQDRWISDWQDIKTEIEKL